MSERSLLVLGASRYQLEVIRKAQDLGFRVITTDNVPENPGHAVADKSLPVDTTDLEGVLAIARTERVAGVVSPCTDVAVATAAYVAEALGLPGVPYASAKTLTSKVLFRAFQVREGLAAPEFRVLSSAAPGDAGAASAAAPLILKPEGSSGSKGIFLVRSEEELRERLPATLEASPSKQAVLERFIDGDQGTCEGVVVDGRIAFRFLTDRETASPPFVATTAHFVPSRSSTTARARTLAEIEDVLSRHGIRNSTFDCDFVVGRDGAVTILELTPRLGGNSLTRLVRESTGIDLAEIAVRQAVGDDVSIPSGADPRPTAQLILGAKSDGKLAFDAEEVARRRLVPWVRDLSFDYPAGHAVQAFTNGRNRVGEATVIADDRDELDARVAELRCAIGVRAVP